MPRHLGDLPGVRRSTAVAIGAVATGALLVAASSASPRRSPSATVSGVPAPPTTITGSLVTNLRGTRRRGTPVPAADLGQRVFVNASDGFSLAEIPPQGTYPAATVNGGRTWRTDGPILHANAAQAPLAISRVGATNSHTYYAWGSQVADVTSDGGKKWWRTVLGEYVLAVVSEPGRLIAVVQNEGTTSSVAETSVYVSTDGGHVWHHNQTVGGR